MRDEEESGMATPASPRLPAAPSRRDWQLPADEPGRDSLLLISADRPERVRAAAGDAAGKGVAAGAVRRYDGKARTKSPAMKHAAQPNADADSHADSHADLDARRLVIACDHRGWNAKQRLLPRLRALGWDVRDLGCDDADTACDYPDYAGPAAQLVADGDADVAVLLDASGIGMGIVANKVRGVRAATCHDEFTARIAREHNHCNVLCVGTDLVGDRALNRIVELFLETEFIGGRHVRRVAKLAELEHQQAARNAEPLRASV